MIENIIIEKMTDKHIDGLVEIEKASFSKPWSREGFESELTNQSANFYVALFNGNEVGYIGFYSIVDECYMANVAVLPEFRRKGIAALLLEYAVMLCRDKGAAFLSLEVRKSNLSAISLYKKFGFETVGERKNFYSAPTENAYIMTLNLKP